MKVRKGLKSASMVPLHNGASRFVSLIVAAITFGASPGVVRAAILYETTGVGGHGSSLLTLDKNTAAPTLIGETGSNATLNNGGLAYNPFNHVFYATGYDNTDPVSQSGFYTIDATTGAATKISHTDPSINWSDGGIAFDTANQTLYAIGSTGNQGSALFSVNPTTGAATVIADNISAPYSNPSSSPVDIYGLGYDPATDTLYGNGFYLFDPAGTSSLWTINVASGTPTFIGQHGVSLGRQLNYGGLAVDPDTHVLYTVGSIDASNSGLYTVNPATGAASLVGAFPSGYGNTDGALVFVSVPEPGSFGLLAVAAFMIARVRTKSKGR